MKDDKYFWNYNKEPGKILKSDYIKDTKELPLVSIITSYYNSQEFMEQTINCVLNQTFPYWEWIIVDDGSTNEDAIEYLEEVEKKDNRIHIYHKKNEGLAKGRDYAIKYSKANYILPLDADDLIEPTYIETLYWTLETNPEATWAFTNSLGFGKYIYLVDHEFDSEIMKNENQITATALIRKEKILKVGGYGVAKRYVNEDWHLWLRLLASGCYPVQTTFYGFWYRRRQESLLSQINNEKSEENKLRLIDLKKEANKITQKVPAIIYPNQIPINLKRLEFIHLNWNKTLPINSKRNIIYILPDTGIDNKLYKDIKNMSINRNITIITLEKSKYSHYSLRQKYEDFATVFNLDTFLDKKYFFGFIEYIINTRNAQKIYVSDNYQNMEIFKEKEIEIIHYNESNFKYKLQIFKYTLKHTLIGKIIRKFIKIG